MFTIEELKEHKQLAKKSVTDACHEVDGNCQACRFEGRCQSETDIFESQIQAHYCKDSNGNCLECDYLGECENRKASVARDKKNRLKKAKRCVELKCDCTQCEYLYGCSDTSAQAERDQRRRPEFFWDSFDIDDLDHFDD